MKGCTVKTSTKNKTITKNKFVTDNTFILQFGFSAPTKKVCFKKYQKPMESNALENGKLLLTKFK